MILAPRPYRMTARAEAVAGTRTRLVAAAKGLHAEQGVVLTSWEQIAERAGVATATAYRHFPWLDELVVACARSVFDIIEPPSVGDAARKFVALDTPGDRFEQLVRDSAACYGKGAGWLHAAHRERDFVPALDAALAVMEDTLWVLVEAAYGASLAVSDQRVLFTLCDFPFWWSLTARAPQRSDLEDRLVHLVRAEVTRITG